MRRLLFLIALLPCITLAQHSIKGTFSPPGEFEIALLYKVEPTHSNYVTNAPIAADGSFEIKLDSTVPKGMYRITYAVPQEEYNFDVIYNGEEDVELKFNSETGVEFLASRENKLLESYTNSMLMITNSIGNYFRDGSKTRDSLALASIFKTQRETQQGFEEASKGTIAFNFIKANSPYIPEDNIDVKAYVKGLEAHYFDHVDFNNEILQRSKFLTERMLNYVFGMSSGNGDEVSEYIRNIKVFCKKMENAPEETQKSLLTDLWEQMVDLKLEKVANFIAEDYLMDLSVKLNDQQLLQALILYQNTSLGNQAPDFSFEIEGKEETVTKTLSKLDIAEHYIVAFWSSSCSHCLKEIPELHKFIEPFEEGKLKVIAIGLEDDPYGWKTLTYDFPNFFHVYGEGKWDNDIGNNYGVTATPTYFILDSDKKIKAKPDTFDELKAFFEISDSPTEEEKE
ncbi:TlpA family protein disulfide reductase [Hyunsoonleella flava]|uniref:TlpA family protein disulfide reductase n=1 Tax=Hyunsoonleella flava TaxID=2527939 RepID=A0A4Q9FA56_9FLAO|nr:TlpA disulfide reductase family protein [Hyunsoonleella flava]TBN00239.1 TlpA family protein disulfide reductase [Hyunsoonleella flava]